MAQGRQTNAHDQPVIAVTAFAMKGDEERIRQGGCEASHLQTHLGRQVPRDDQVLSGGRVMTRTFFRIAEPAYVMTARILVVDDIPANVKLLEVRLLAEYFESSHRYRAAATRSRSARAGGWMSCCSMS